ncbi:MAG: ATP-binding protein [Bacteroidota bacterium]|nr:ATP-binding protein [Bacteroidota bacterium]
MFRNLLSNAIKFTPQKGKIEITANKYKTEEPEKHQYIICFKDTGVGIPKDQISKIFDVDRNFSKKEPTMKKVSA